MAEKLKRGGHKKPAHLAGPVSAVQRLWNAIRGFHALARRFTRADVEHESKVNGKTAQNYFERLVKGGYIEADRKLPRNASRSWFSWARYTLVRDVGSIAPRLRRDGSEAEQGVARERMWQTVRILAKEPRGFNAVDVQLPINAAGGKPIPLASVKDYLAQLVRGGYLKVVAPARCGRGRTLARYSLLPSMNTGPRSPIAQRSGAIYDPNLDRVMREAR